MNNVWLFCLIFIFILFAFFRYYLSFLSFYFFQFLLSFAFVLYFFISSFFVFIWFLSLFLPFFLLSILSSFGVYSFSLFFLSFFLSFVWDPNIILKSSCAIFQSGLKVCEKDKILAKKGWNSRKKDDKCWPCVCQMNSCLENSQEGDESRF